MICPQQRVPGRGGDSASRRGLQPESDIESSSISGPLARTHHDTRTACRPGTARRCGRSAPGPGRAGRWGRLRRPAAAAQPEALGRIYVTFETPISVRALRRDSDSKKTPDLLSSLPVRLRLGVRLPAVALAGRFRLGLGGVRVTGGPGRPGHSELRLTL